MSSVRSLAHALPLLLLVPHALAQVSLADVAKIARARAERSRPAQQKALEPYWSDLQLPYRVNQQHLDPRISEVAALGDSVVPLLLEKLQPSTGGDNARNLASNCRRVLEKLDPGSFLDALVELANGTHEIGRTEAIQLLGIAQAPQAVTVLIDLLDRLSGEDKRLVVRALRLQKSAAAAPKIVTMLASNDPQVREDALTYLIAARPAAVADTVIQALPNEKNDKLLPAYVEYFAAAVKASDAAARALLPLLNPERIDFQLRKRIVQALATVAPKDHEPTIRALHAILDSDDVTSLGVQSALSLRTLGDKQGVTKLKRTLDDQLRKPKRREEASLYETKASLLFALDEYADAIDNYEKALQYQDGQAMTRRAYVGMMRCEARRKNRIGNLTKLMKQSGLSVFEIEAIGNEDPVFQETLQRDAVRTFLTALAKEQAPR